MNTTQLECFLAVAETLSFARAAERMNVTQPAVTGQIHTLEEELGTRLFKRTTRYVELTVSGLAFIEDARSIIDIERRSKERFRSNIDLVRKDFIIGAYVSAELPGVSEILSGMRKRYPNINPMFKIIPFMHLFQQLAEENIDIIFSFEENIQRKNIVFEEVAKVGLSAVMEKDHLLSKKKCITKADLSGEKLILLDPHHCPVIIDKLQHQISDGKSISDIYLSETLSASLTMVKAGFGIAIVPELITVRQSTLAYVPLKLDTSISYGVYYSKIVQKPEINDFLTLMRESFRRNAR